MWQQKSKMFNNNNKITQLTEKNEENINNNYIQRK